MPASETSCDAVRERLAPVTVVGGANMDVGARTDIPLLAGDSTPGHIAYAPGGVGRNIAENLARLGISTTLATVVGDDAFGRQLVAATAQAGVQVQAMHALAGQRTATYLSLHGPDGDMAWAVNDMSILEHLTPSWCQSHVSELSPGAVMVVDCNLATDTLAYLLSLTGSVVVDAVSVAKCQRIAPWLPAVHLLKVNALEAQALCGMPITKRADALAAVQRLQTQGAQRVVLSLGSQGVVWCDVGGQSGFEPARPVPVVNTSGAGDALLAGVVAAMQRGFGLPEAVGYGMACAEITLSSPAANALDLSHLAVVRHYSCAL